MQSRMKKDFIIKNLSIQAKELVIRSDYPPDRDPTESLISHKES